MSPLFLAALLLASPYSPSLDPQAASGFASGGTLTDSMTLARVTIAADDTTPDVSNGNIFLTSANTGATAITDLDLPEAGQVFEICGGSNTNPSTIANAGNFVLKGGPITLFLDYCITLYAQADNDYVELSRSSRRKNIVTLTVTDSPYAMLVGVDIVLCDATGGAVTVVPPTAAAAIAGHTWDIKKIDASANACIIDPASNIDGAASQSTTVQWYSNTITTDGSNYFNL